MKRFVACCALVGFLLGAAIGPYLFAAARTANTDGRWNDTATWGGASVPGLGDACTINAGIEVYCDTTPCQCGSMALNGGLLNVDASRIVKIGNFTGTTGDGDFTIAAAGSYQQGPGNTLEFNCNRSANNSVCRFTNNGAMSFQGRRILGDLTVTAVGAMGTGNPRKQVLTLSGMPKQAIDAYSGYMLVGKSGWFTNHRAEITTGGATAADVAVNMDSRGTTDTRHTDNRVNPTASAPGDMGETYSTGTATVASGNTAVTFNTAFGSLALAQATLLGSLFVCNADIGAANDWSNFRRICDVPTSSTATLCQTYGTANCAAGAAFRVYDRNEPPHHIVIREEFQVGDKLEIWQPSVITITAGNRSDTAPSNHYNIAINDGSNTFMRGVQIDYCGKDDGAGFSPACIDVTGIDNANSSEQFSISEFDIFHYSGEDALITHTCDNIHILDGEVHDASEGALQDGHEAHGIYLYHGSSGTHNQNMEIGRVRIEHANDAGIVVSGGSSSGVVCQGCDFHDLIIGGAPANRGATTSGITTLDALNGGSTTLGGSYVRDSLFFNLENNGLLFSNTSTTPTSPSTLAAVNVLAVNTQISGAGAQLGAYVAGSGLGDTSNKNVMAGSAVIGADEEGVQRGYTYDSFVATLNSFSGTRTGVAFWQPQGVTGGIIQGPPIAATSFTAGVNHEPTGSSENYLSPSTVTLRDMAFVMSPTVPTSGNILAFRLRAQASGVTTAYLIDHASFFMREADFKLAGTGDGFPISEGVAASKINNITNSVFADARTCIDEAAAGAGGDTTSSYNLYWKCLPDTSGVTQGSSELTTSGGTSYPLSFKDVYGGDLSALKGSAQWTNLGSDGYVRGIRVGGPPRPERLTRLFPFPLLADMVGVPGMPTAAQSEVIRIVNANSIGDSDTDGDGVWNLHDNCPTVWNPSQYDGDGDGKGCACDANETCP